MKYRIVLQKNGKYICQRKGRFFWHNMFCGSHSDLPTTFDGQAQAEIAIKRHHEALTIPSPRPGVVKVLSYDE